MVDGSRGFDTIVHTMAAAARTSRSASRSPIVASTLPTFATGVRSPATSRWYA